MAKLGYTWYPKDWGNSDSVFELSLCERGLYREFIDFAMLNDNKTELFYDLGKKPLPFKIQYKSISGKTSITLMIKSKLGLFLPESR